MGMVARLGEPALTISRLATKPLLSSDKRLMEQVILASALIFHFS
jgi:hypothetical protein